MIEVGIIVMITLAFFTIGLFTGMVTDFKDKVSSKIGSICGLLVVVLAIWIGLSRLLSSKEYVKAGVFPVKVQIDANDLQYTFPYYMYEEDPIDVFNLYLNQPEFYNTQDSCILYKLDYSKSVGLGLYWGKAFGEIQEELLVQ